MVVGVKSPSPRTESSPAQLPDLGIYLDERDTLLCALIRTRVAAVVVVASREQSLSIYSSRRATTTKKSLQ